MDCKEIQPVHSEGDQPWDFFGRNDAKGETPVYAQGLPFNKPVADNETEEGRAKNRRVEIYITANEDMVKAVEAGTLK